MTRTILCRFHDRARPEELHTYRHGLLFVGLDDDGSVLWTEGVRVILHETMAEECRRLVEEMREPLPLLRADRTVEWPA